MTTTSPLKENRSTTKVIGGKNAGSEDTATDSSVVTLLQKPLSVVETFDPPQDPDSSMDPKAEKNPAADALEESAILDETQTPSDSASKKPSGNKVLWEFSRMITELIGTASRSAADQSKAENAMGQSILKAMKAKENEIAKERARQESKKKLAFLHLLFDITKLLVGSTVGIEGVLIGAAIKSQKQDGLKFGKAFGDFFSKTAIDIAANPALSKFMTAVTVIADIFLVLGAFSMGGPAMGIFMLGMILATQVKVGKKDHKQSLIGGTSTLIAKVVEVFMKSKGGEEVNPTAKVLADGILIGVGIALSLGTCGLTAPALLGSSITIGVLTPQISEDVADASKLEGGKKEWLQVGLSIGLGLTAALMGMAAFCAATEQTAQTAEEVGEAEMAEIGTTSEEELSHVENSFREKMRLQLRRLRDQLGEFKDNFLVGCEQNLSVIAKLSAITQLFQGMLNMMIGGGNIAISDIETVVQTLSSQLDVLQSQQEQITKTVQQTQKNLNNIIEGYKTALAAGQTIASGIASYTL